MSRTLYNHSSFETYTIAALVRFVRRQSPCPALYLTVQDYGGKLGSLRWDLSGYHTENPTLALRIGDFQPQSVGWAGRVQLAPVVDWPEAVVLLVGFGCELNKRCRQGPTFNTRGRIPYLKEHTKQSAAWANHVLEQFRAERETVLAGLSTAAETPRQRAEAAREAQIAEIDRRITNAQSSVARLQATLKGNVSRHDRKIFTYQLQQSTRQLDELVAEKRHLAGIKKRVKTVQDKRSAEAQLRGLAALACWLAKRHRRYECAQARNNVTVKLAVDSVSPQEVEACLRLKFDWVQCYVRGTLQAPTGYRFPEECYTSWRCRSHASDEHHIVFTEQAREFILGAVRYFWLVKETA